MKSSPWKYVLVIEWNGNGATFNCYMRKMLHFVAANTTSLHFSPPAASQSYYGTELPVQDIASLKFAISYTLYCRYYCLAARMFYKSRTLRLHISTTDYNPWSWWWRLHHMVCHGHTQWVATVENEAARDIVIKSKYVPLKSNHDEFHDKPHRRCSCSHLNHANQNAYFSCNPRFVFYARLSECMKHEI